MVRLRTAVCSVPGCPVLVEGKGRCGGSCCDGRCRDRVQVRPTTTEQGYGARWRAVRDAFVAAHPVCAGDGSGSGGHHPECDGRTTVADHDPVTRRELVDRGDPDPDAWHHLVPRSAQCHGRKTAWFDGGWGNAPKNRSRSEEKA